MRFRNIAVTVIKTLCKSREVSWNMERRLIDRSRAIFNHAINESAVYAKDIAARLA